MNAFLTSEIIPSSEAALTVSPKIRSIDEKSLQLPTVSHTDAFASNLCIPFLYSRAAIDLADSSLPTTAFLLS